MVWNIFSTGANLANYSIEPIIVTSLTKNYYSLYRIYVTAGLKRRVCKSMPKAVCSGAVYSTQAPGPYPWMIESAR